MASEQTTTGALPDDIRVLYENAIGNIEFSKRQQWWVAAQTLVLYAGVFGLFVSIEKHSFSEMLVFDAAIAVIALVSLYFVQDYNFWRDGERERMVWIRQFYFSNQGRKAWRKKEEYRAKRRWWPVSKYFDPGYFLHLIIILGAGGVVYRFWTIYQLPFEFHLCWT